MKTLPTKSTLPVIVALMFVSVSSGAIAQSQEGQQACEGDVYELCGDAIPDQDKIVACLRKRWSKVSKECRKVMVNYSKNHRKTKRRSASEPAGMGPMGY